MDEIEVVISQELTTFLCVSIICSYIDTNFNSTLDKVMQASRADSTVKKYNHARAAWELWCRMNRVSPNCINHENIARYLIYMYHNNAPYSRIESAFYAIRWSLDSSPSTAQLNPCDSRFLRLLLDGLKRLLARPVSRKEPITAEILASIISKFDKGDLKGLRLCSMLLLAYAAFLRYNELANLKVCFSY